MLIKEWMSKSVITIDNKDFLTDAAKFFKTKVISMLPVIGDGKLIGILTDGDVKKARPVVSIQAVHTIDEAAGIMLSNGISGMPVVSNGGKIEGIITKSDIFRCFVSFTGVSNKGQVFAFNLQDKPGIIKNLTDMIRNSGGRLCSIMTSYDDIEEGFRKVFFHTFDIEYDKFNDLLEKFRRAGQLLYAAVLSRGFRKIF
jgi:acetoin utilization protein AcuB